MYKMEMQLLPNLFSDMFEKKSDVHSYPNIHAHNRGLLYIPKVQCSEGPIFRRFYIPKVLCSEGSIFRRFYVPKVLYSEGSMFQKSIANSVFLPTKYIMDQA